MLDGYIDYKSKKTETWKKILNASRNITVGWGRHKITNLVVTFECCHFFLKLALTVKKEVTMSTSFNYKDSYVKTDRLAYLLFGIVIFILEKNQTASHSSKKCWDLRVTAQFASAFYNGWWLAVLENPSIHHFHSRYKSKIVKSITVLCILVRWHLCLVIV